MNLSNLNLKPKLNLKEYPFLICETDEFYHSKSGEYLSSHLLKDYRSCPYLYRKKILGLVKDEDHASYKIGRAAHKLILEGRDAYQESYAIGGPINPKTQKPYGANTKAFAEWAEEQGKPSLTESQSQLVEDSYQGAGMHAIAQDLLSVGFPEMVVRDEYAGMQCQIRMDWFNPERGLIDLKTCENLTFFESDARRYGYIHQLAFYRSVLEKASGTKFPVYLVAVEKREPYRCGVWKVGEGVLAIAQKENETAISKLINSNKKDYWPTGYEEVRSFDYL